MTIKAFLATDCDDNTYIYFIDDVKYLQRNSNGCWEISEDFEEDCYCVHLENPYDMSDSFGLLDKYIKSELERVHIPARDEDPVEIDINLSINWF